MGHQPLGSAHGWLDATSATTTTTIGKQVDAQYLAFFRDAMTRFVSSVLYVNRHKNLTLEKVVQSIKKRVTGARRKGKYHNEYATYLITPQQQRALDEMNNATMKDRTNLVLQNLVDYPVAIGIVERMLESLEILQYILDSKDEIRGLFKVFGMDSNWTRVTTNKSTMSSSAVVKELCKDEAFMKEFREYVKYEDIVFAFAWKLHLRQHQFVKAARNVTL